MECSISGLLNELTTVRPGLSNTELIEQSNMFIFKNGKVWTYNDEISVSTKSELAEGFEGAVPGDILFKLLTKLNKKDSLVIEGSEEDLKLKCKRTRITLRIEKEIQIPIDAQNTDSKKWKTLPKEVLDIIKLCQFSTAKDVIRPVLSCVHCYKNHITSCDSTRATRYTLNDKHTKTFIKPVLVPGNIINHLSKFDINQYQYDGAWLHFGNSKNDDFLFSCRSYEDRYPNIDNFFSDNSGTEITFPARFSSALGKTTVMSEADGTGKYVHIIVDKKILSVSGESDYGLVSETMPIKHTGEKVSFNINPSFLQDILTNLRKTTVNKKRVYFQGDNFKHVIALMTIGE